MRTLVNNFNQTTEGFNLIGKAAVILILIGITVAAGAVAIGVVLADQPINFSY